MKTGEGCHEREGDGMLLQHVLRKAFGESVNDHRSSRVQSHKFSGFLGTVQ